MSKTYPTIEALIEEPANVATLQEGKQRVYAVTPKGKDTVYVLSHSPGRAAMAVCDVETCTQKDLFDAFLARDIRKAKS
jgi:hypothetical protein